MAGLIFLWQQGGDTPPPPPPPPPPPVSTVGSGGWEYDPFRRRRKRKREDDEPPVQESIPPPVAPAEPAEPPRPLVDLDEVRARIRALDAEIARRKQAGEALADIRRERQIAHSLQQREENRRRILSADDEWFMIH